MFFSMIRQDSEEEEEKWMDESREVNPGLSQAGYPALRKGKGWECLRRQRWSKNKQTKRQDSVWPFEIMDISHVRDMPLVEGSIWEIIFRWRSEEGHSLCGKGEQAIFIFSNHYIHPPRRSSGYGPRVLTRRSLARIPAKAEAFRWGRNAKGSCTVWCRCASK